MFAQTSDIYLLIIYLQNLIENEIFLKYFVKLQGKCIYENFLAFIKIIITICLRVIKNLSRPRKTDLGRASAEGPGSQPLGAQIISKNTNNILDF